MPRSYTISRTHLLLAITLAVTMSGCAPPAEVAIESVDDPPSYELQRVLEVAGRQGIATDGVSYFVSGSTALYVYTKDGDLLRANEEPFLDLAKPANHIGDIAVHDGEIFAGIEWFDDGQGHEIQVAVYDSDSLEYLRSIAWNPDSGQVEVSAVTIDPDNNLIWMTDWVNGRHVYRYDLVSGEYRGKLQLRPVPHGQQGIAYREGFLFITADDGDADLDEADSLWRARAEPTSPSAFVTLELELSALRRAGEIEGVAWDEATEELLVLSNRGARIVLGMPSGFYPGYDREIHEVYVFRRR
jgi:hypothetical protein